MNENSLTILIKSYLSKEEIIYNSGEIEKVEFQKTKKEGNKYFYKLEIFSKRKGNIKNIPKSPLQKNCVNIFY